MIFSKPDEGAATRSSATRATQARIGCQFETGATMIGVLLACACSNLIGFSSLD